MDTIVKRLMENRKLNESNSNASEIELESEIRDAVRETMMSSEFGFPEDEVDDYSAVEIRDTDVEGYIEVEVRAEVSYEGLEELCDRLNPIVAKYDSDSYFEPVTSGIISAYVHR